MEEHLILEELSREFYCSTAMERELYPMLHYLAIKSNDLRTAVNDIKEKMQEEGLLPCEDKKHGKDCLEAFKKETIAYKTCIENQKEPEVQPERVFQRIYVERDIKDKKETSDILKKFPDSEIIEIDDCKEIFFGRKQDKEKEREQKSLILARQHAKLLYPGAPVCQSFGNEYFYYTSCIKNCIYDCEYCYLKGMYPSQHMVVYVDLESVFDEVRMALKEHPVYLCVSYDTDLLAVESLFHFAKRWIEFTAQNPGLRIEIRTKSANAALIKSLPKCDRVVYAFTISPEEIAEKYERKAPNLKARLEAAHAAMDEGLTVRLCFDPMIYTDDWKTVYRKMLDTVLGAIDIKKLLDVSVGGFRISASYLKNMRRVDAKSEIVWFPFENIGGYYMYPKEIQDEMIGTFTKWLGENMDINHIYL